MSWRNQQRDRQAAIERKKRRSREREQAIMQGVEELLETMAQTGEISEHERPGIDDLETGQVARTFVVSKHVKGELLTKRFKVAGSPQRFSLLQIQARHTQVFCWPESTRRATQRRAILGLFQTHS